LAHAVAYLHDSGKEKYLLFSTSSNTSWCHQHHWHVQAPNCLRRAIFDTTIMILINDYLTWEPLPRSVGNYYYLEYLTHSGASWPKLNREVIDCISFHTICHGSLHNVFQLNLTGCLITVSPFIHLLILSSYITAGII